ncbi:MAG: hypothetical protein LUH05_01430 [Candidatus Gastranaerophilales bacterium]|nr:hypothetical protein [Candidatus Gastranaerophilales bacterium]
MTEEFYNGQIFTDEYPPQAAEWCNENGYYINEAESTNDGSRQFEIVEVSVPTEDELAQIEQERIDNLTMTALDFINCLQSQGLTLEDINEYLENNLEIKMQLTYCKDVYCGVVKEFCPITVGDFTLTADMVETIFLEKYEENKNA